MTVVNVLMWLGLGLVVVLLTLVLFTAWTARRVEARLPPLGRFIDVEGQRIHYVESGSGPHTLLMIHGLAGNGRIFTEFAAGLAGEYRVIVMDRPGAGYSTRGTGAPAGPFAQADAVAGFITKLGLERPVLVGHSLGGAVSLATAVRHPELVRGLVLIAPLTHSQSLPKVFAGLQMPNGFMRGLIGWTMATPLSMVMKDKAMDQIFGPEAVTPEFDTKGGGMFVLRPATFISSSEDVTAVSREMDALSARYGEIRVPTGVIYGTGDRVLDYRLQGEAMRGRIGNLRLELIDDAGHMLPLTAPARVAGFVREIAQAC